MSFMNASALGYPLISCINNLFKVKVCQHLVRKITTNTNYLCIHKLFIILFCQLRDNQFAVLFSIFIIDTLDIFLGKLLLFFVCIYA